MPPKDDPPKSTATKTGTNADIWIAGAAAAFTVDLIVYPLDTIKTRIQSPDYRKLYRNASNTGFNPSMFRGVYQGVGSVILATLPSSGAFFTTYEAVKALLSDRQTSLHLPTPAIHAAASATAELVSCAILTPAEVIKQNAQMFDPSSSRGGSNATMDTLRRFRSNPLALWRGYFALASRNLPFTALQFPLFEKVKVAIRKRRDENGTRTNTLLEGATITAVSAGIGGSVAAVVTTPVDVVKTRIMLAAAAEGRGGDEDEGRKEGKGGKGRGKEGGRGGGGAGLKDATGKKVGEKAKEVVKRNFADAGKRKSSMDIAREVVKEQGVKGLFRGGALRGVWTMLGSGLYLGVYEGGRIYLAERRGEKLDIDDLE